MSPNVTLTDDPAVLALWWIAVALTALVIVPAAVYLLHRVLRAARMIERYTAETLAAGAGIAKHAEAIPALEGVVAAAGPIVERSRSLATAAGRLESLLAGGAAGGRAGEEERR